MKISRLPLDILFKKYLRLRDKVCQRCGSLGNGQVSHFWGRARRSTRWDDDNCDLMCFGCHSYLGSHPAEYTAWKLKRLGQAKFDMLEARASRVPKNKVDTTIIELYIKDRIRTLTT